MRTHGGVVEQTRVPDDPERLRELVRSWRVDLIVTAGGISMGAYEVVRQGLPELTFHHVAQQPGGPKGLEWWPRRPCSPYRATRSGPT